MLPYLQSVRKIGGSVSVAAAAGHECDGVTDSDGCDGGSELN